MGLGSLVEFVPVMENDFHCDVFKESEYTEATNTLCLTDSGATDVNMLSGCFTDKNCEPLSLKSSLVAKDYSVSFPDNYQSGLQNYGNDDGNRRCVLEKHIVPLHGNGLKPVLPSKETVVLKGISSAKQEFSEVEAIETVGLKEVENLEEKQNSFVGVEAQESVTERKECVNRNSAYLDGSVGSVDGNCSLLNDGVTSKVSGSYPPLSISVSETDRKTYSVSSIGEQKGLLRKATHNLSSVAYFRAEQKVSPAFSTSDDGLFLPNEQVLNKALDLFKIPSAGISAQSSRIPSPASLKASTCTSPSGKKEVAKRKTMQERLIRLPRLITTCPQLEHAPTMHWAMLLRRFKKYYPVGEYISEEVIQHVLNEERSYTQMNLELKNGSPLPSTDPHLNLHGFRTINDPNATESSSEEEEELPGPSTSRENRTHISRESASYRYLKEQIEIYAQDFRAAQIIEDCNREIETTKQQLTVLREKKSPITLHEVNGNDVGSSARCRPYTNRVRRKLLKFLESDPTRAMDFANSLDAKERVRGYASIDDRINPELSFLRAVPLERRMQAYIKRRASRPLKFLQQRLDCPAWKSHANSGSETWEEQQRAKKELYEGSPTGSIGRECNTFRKARRNNHSSKSVSPLKRAGKRLVKRSLDQKRHGERYSNSRSRTRHLEKRRSVHFLPRIFREFNYDDSGMQESGLPGLPPKIDYKEICIPPWKYVPHNIVKALVDSPCSHLAEGATPAEISRRHLPLELSERKRFQQYRDFVASKSAAGVGTLTPETAVSNLPSVVSSSKLAGTGPTVASSLETASSACSRAQSPVAPSSLEDERHSSANDITATPEYDRPSIAPPYTPRHFPLSSPIYRDSS